MLAKDASLTARPSPTIPPPRQGLKDNPGQETELSIASRSLFTNDLLPCPVTGAEEGLAAGDVLSTGCENLCKLLQREVQIWSDTCHSFANSRKLSGILQDGVDYVAALALVLFVLACRVNKMEVAAVVASWVLRISLLAFTQAASIPAAALLACVVALATMRLTNEAPLPSASAVQSFFLQFGVAFIAVTGMSEWPVVGLALLAASMASVLVLLAVHGPEGQAGCSVSKSVWSNANMTKQGKKSRRRFLWLLRDSSWCIAVTGASSSVCHGNWWSSKRVMRILGTMTNQILHNLTALASVCFLLISRIPRPCISIAALDDAISEVTRLRGLLSDLAALVLEELKKASDSAAPQADNSSDSEASESASAPLPHSTAAAATTVHVKVPTTHGHTRLSVEALTVEDAMTKLAASVPHLAWETFWLSHHGRLLKTLPTDCDADNPIDVILRCPGGGNEASRMLRQPLEELGETLRSVTGDTRATPPTSNEAAAGSPAEDGEEGVAAALERERKLQAKVEELEAEITSLKAASTAPPPQTCSPPAPDPEHLQREELPKRLGEGAAGAQGRDEHDSGVIAPEAAMPPLNKFFEELGAGSSGGTMDVTQLEKSLLERESALIVSQSQTFQKHRDAGGEVNLEEFEKIAGELEHAALVRFFESMELPQHFAKAAKIAMMKALGSTMRDPLQPFASIATQLRASRLEFCRELIKIAASLLEEAMADSLISEKEYKEANEIVGCDDKYSKMHLGPLAVFDKGLENVIGPPDMNVFAGMAKEHLGNTEEFTAYNGKERTSTPEKEWKKVLPEQTDEDPCFGKINNRDYEGDNKLCEDFMSHPLVEKAGLAKLEIVALRLYTGPMFKHYNGKMRKLMQDLVVLYAPKKDGKDLTPTELKEAFEAALAEVRKATGRSWVNTIHALTSALIKLSRVTVLPPSGCGFRGQAGLAVPDCFTRADEFGCRGGVEGGFVSTSTDKEQALHYVQYHKQMPQLYEIRYGQINRGADVSAFSYFPGEKEILLMPLSSLEVAGPTRYEKTPQGLIMVTPLAVNINLKSRTLQELQAMRKELLLRAADNTLNNDIRLFLDHLKSRHDVKQKMHSGGILNEEEDVDKMVAQIWRECEGAVEEMKARPEEYYNQDATYKVAYEDLTELRPLAAGLVDLWLSGGVHALSASGLKLKEAKQLRMRHTMEQLEAAKEKGEEKEVRELALKLCSIQRLFNVDIEERDSEGFTPLLRWTNQGFLPALRLLRDAGAQLAAQSSTQEDTALHLAFRNKHTDCALELCKHGALVNMQNKRGDTALHLAASNGQREAAEALLKAGADTDAQDKDGWTVLISAASGGDAKTVVMLLEKGASASINAADERGRTALHWAADGGQTEAAEALLKAGADIEAKDKDGKTVLMFAAHGGHSKTVVMLLEKGASASINAADGRDGWTALHLAALEGQTEAAEALLKAGADIEAKTPSGQTTVLMLAARGGHAKTVVMLLEKGASASINAADEDGDTALHWAADEGQTEAAEALLKAGADIEAKNNHGETPLKIARYGGQEEMVKLLESKGARSEEQ